MAATLTRTLAPVVDLDTRLALAAVAMDVRLDHALLAFDVNTAHLPDTAPEQLVAPILPTLEPAPAPAVTPIADSLQRARSILADRGWHRGHLRSEDGAVCLIGAIRAAAPNRRAADDACVYLLDVIQQHFTDAETVPSWNDAQTSSGPVLRILGAAADHAADRGI